MCLRTYLRGMQHFWSLRLGMVLCENSHHIFIFKIPIRSLPSLLIILEKQDLVLKGPVMFGSAHSAQSLMHFCSGVPKVAKPQNVFNLFFKVVEPCSKDGGKEGFIMAVSGWVLPPCGQSRRG